MIRITTVILMIMLTGCVSPAQRADFVNAHPKISDEYKQAILHGQIMKGITKDEVRASWGNPCSYCYGTTHNSWGDSWEYNVFGSGSYGAGNGTYVYFDGSGHVTGWSGH